MKTYICHKCIKYGGKAPCTLTCEDDMKPTHCPHDDSAYPNADWQEADPDINNGGLCKICGGLTVTECCNCGAKY